MDDARLVAASAIALSVTLFAIFSMRPVAKRLGLVDRPDARKRHRGRVPLVGGLCFFLGTIMGLAYLGYIDQLVASLLVPGTLIVMTGVVDDMCALSVRSRLVIQGCTAFIVIAATGVYVTSGGNILGGHELYFGLLGLPITIVAVIGLMNAFNMLDGIDGLAASIAMVTIASVLLFADASWPTLGVVLLLQVLFAALVPYLCVNLGWPDGRKIFMGDAGSTLIGFLLAWSLIFLSHRGIARMHPVDALWCVALPVMDTLAVMFRRARKGLSPFKPDRQHLHHLLLDAGCSPRVALTIIVAAASTLALLGYSLRHAPETASMVVFAGVLALYVLRFDRLAVRLGALLPWHAIRGASQPARRMEPEPQPAAAIASSGGPVRALCVVATPADAAQIAPIAQRLARDRRFATHVCIASDAAKSTESLLRLFDVAPDVQFDATEHAGDPTGATSAALAGMKRVLGEFKPDVVLVPGHTSTAAAATALAAFYQQIPVACVEPSRHEATSASQPDEANRRITCTLASMHFTPTESSGRHLVASGVPSERILVTGNTATGTLRAATRRIRRDALLRRQLAKRFAFLRNGSPLLVVAGCRDDEYGFEPMCRALRRVATRRQDADIVCLTEHPFDAMGRGELLRGCGNVHLVAAADYLAFSYLLTQAYLILAASAEVATDVATLGKPVVQIQADASIPAINLANVRRIGVHEQTIASDLLRLLADRRVYDAMCRTPERQGEDACVRIIETLAELKDGATLSRATRPSLGVVPTAPVEDLRQAS